MNLTLWNRPRRLDLLKENLKVTYDSKSEHSLRDAIGTLAYVLGWEVATEVPVPGDGRIDLVMFTDTTMYAVELKLQIRTNRELRIAMSQCDSYRRLAIGLPQRAESFWCVTSVERNRELSDDIDEAFPGVWYWGTGHLLSWLKTEDCAERQPIAERRFAKLTTAYEAIAAGLPKAPEPEPEPDPEPEPEPPAHFADDEHNDPNDEEIAA